MNSEQLWQSVIGELELSISKANFTTWFKDTHIIHAHGDTVTIGVPNSFTEAWLQKKYKDDILQTIKKKTNNTITQIIFKVDTNKNIQPIEIGEEVKSDTQEDVEQPQQQKKSAPPPLTSMHPVKSGYSGLKPVFSNTQNNSGDNTIKSSFNLNPKYIFDNFIVGKGNELAYAACKAVVDNPGSMYNPLFIYGGVGLGKTHLVQAAGNAILEQNPDLKILYITTEKFTNDYIQAVKNGQMEKFRSNYRSVDILLVDDIQFMSGKDQTQEEFFHTFNALYQNNKQIIITSDRPPMAIPSLERRLVSRFASGMIADISQPDLETRVAILEHKVHEKNLNVPKNILQYLADQIQTNIRELEGALNKIVAMHQLNDTTPDMETAKRVVSSLTATMYQGSLTAKQIISAVANYYGITVQELVSLSRKKDLVIPRQIAMYIVRTELNSSFPTIGDELGGRDHTTAMHACTKIGDLVKKDEKIKHDVETIITQIHQQRAS